MQRLSRAAVLSLAGARCASSGIVEELKTTLKAKRAEIMPKIKELKTKYGNEVLSDATLEKAYGGMRDITGLVYEPSLLDKNEGIRFRGLTIPECQEKLPKATADGEPLPEAMLWLLLTGDVPTVEQAKALNAELQKRADENIIAIAKRTLDALPLAAHPMTQFSMGVMALQNDSKFAQAYAAGKANKDNYWELALEDSLNCIARSPSVAAMVYRRLVSGKSDIAPIDKNLDWTANFCNQMGMQDPGFHECMRLYLSIHVDHEGGNVSAHTTTLVGSALSDPYLSFSAGLNGLAGPLHGLANQEVLGYLFEMREKLKAAKVDINDSAALKEALTKFTWDILNSKRVIPGYGHAVLRKTDPRYTCQQAFCLKHFPEDPLFKLVNTVYEIMPGILEKHGKTKNPYPNVDAHSGVLLQHYGLTQQNYYTVLFGVSRQIGVLSGLVWDRLQGRAIERPKSVTTEYLCKKFNVQ
jgi:citrate synthase